MKMSDETKRASLNEAIRQLELAQATVGGYCEAIKVMGKGYPYRIDEANTALVRVVQRLTEISYAIQEDIDAKKTEELK